MAADFRAHLPTIRTALMFLLPSFLHPSPNPATSTKSGAYQAIGASNARTPVHRPTAYLDGIRGVASLCVYFTHLLYTTHNLAIGWNPSPDTPEAHSLLRLPILRFPYTGPSMVSIFYVVSGYSLSYNYLQNIHSHNMPKVWSGLSSLAFRRGMRLFLPCLASTLMIALLIWMGAYEWTRDIAEDETLLNGNREHHPERLKGGLFAQLLDWALSSWHFVNPFTWGYKDVDSEYDPHLWTIPIEMRASMVLFIVQLCVARLKPRIRQGLVVLLSLWFLAKAFWELMLFCAGLLLAEGEEVVAPVKEHLSPLPVITCNEGHELSTDRAETFVFPPKPPNRWRHFNLWNLLYLCHFVCALYLCSQPPGDTTTTPGWMLLTKFTPISWHIKRPHPNFFWGSLGAIQLVYATSRARFLQRLFDNALVAYIGKLSFAIYLMHSMVIHIIGYACMRLFWSWTGVETDVAKEGGFFMAATVTTIVLFWVSDLFWRGVDVQSVRFARWLERKCLSVDII